MPHSIPRWYRTVALMCTAISALDARVLVAQGASTAVQPARLTGRVADALGSAIEKAEILVSNTSFRAETGTDGRFELAGLPSGPVEVVVRRLGFSPAKIPLELGSGEMRDIRVLLSPVAMMMDSVDVTAAAPTIGRRSVGSRCASRAASARSSRASRSKKNPRVTTDLFRSVSGVKLCGRTERQPSSRRDSARCRSARCATTSMARATRSTGSRSTAWFNPRTSARSRSTPGRDGAAVRRARVPAASLRSGRARA